MKSSFACSLVASQPVCTTAGSSRARKPVTGAARGGTLAWTARLSALTERGNGCCLRQGKSGFLGTAKRGEVRLTGSRVRAGAQGDASPVGDVMLPDLDQGDLEREAQWLGRTIANWLDDEWCEQQVHVNIGDSLCKAYLAERKKGNREATSILLKLSDDLKRVDFTEAFVNPFDVSNKALECLMFKSGIDVCCQSDQERKFLEDSLKDV